MPTNFKVNKQLRIFTRHIKFTYNNVVNLICMRVCISKACSALTSLRTISHNFQFVSSLKNIDLCMLLFEI